MGQDVSEQRTNNLYFCIIFKEILFITNNSILLTGNQSQREHCVNKMLFFFLMGQSGRFFKNREII